MCYSHRAGILVSLMLSWWSLVRSRLIALVWFVCCLISSWRDPRLSWFLAKVNSKSTVLSAMYKLVLRTFFQISEWSISNRGAMCCESNVSIDMDTSYLYMIYSLVAWAHRCHIVDVFGYSWRLPSIVSSTLERWPPFLNCFHFNLMSHHATSYL